MRKKYGIDIYFPTDPLRPLDFHPFNLMQRSFRASFRNVLWLFSDAAYERAKKILDELGPFVPNQHHSFVVKNYTYRGNIICSGLLMVTDYRKAINKALREFNKRKIKIDLMVLAHNSFDRYGNDLTGENYVKLIDEFKIPIWLG